MKARSKAAAPRRLEATARLQARCPKAAWPVIRKRVTPGRGKAARVVTQEAERAPLVPVLDPVARPAVARSAA